MRTGRARIRGFAYVLLLASVAVIGVAAAAALTVGATVQRRSAERQLLVIGDEYRRALESFAGAPPGVKASQVQGPKSLDELLKDPRVPGLKRHLRRIYDDPLTGSNAWGTVTNARGEIVGIYSLAPGRPIKQSGFDVAIAWFEGAQNYSQWVFGFLPEVPAPSP